MADFLTLEELESTGRFRALADAFCYPADAHKLLDLINFPRMHRPGRFDTAYYFWNEVCQQIERGKTVGGLQALFDAAASLYPGNTDLFPAPRMPVAMQRRWHEKLPRTLSFSEEVREFLRGHRSLSAVPLPLQKDPTFARLCWEYDLVDRLFQKKLKGLLLRPGPRIDSCYRRSFPEHKEYHYWSKVQTTPLDYAWELVDLGVPLATYRHPLLVFVRLLREEVVPEECWGELDAWEEDAVAQLAAHYGVAKDTLRSALSSDRPRGEAAPEGPCWVSIVVRKVVGESGRFTVTGWVSSPGEEWVPLYDGEPVPVKEQDLERCFADLREEALTVLSNPRLQAPPDIHIEVFLPWALLCREADQWLLKPDISGTAFPVGVNHPFVVRCLERWDNKEACMALRRRWGHVAQAGAPPAVVTELPVEGYAAYRLERLLDFSPEDYLMLRRSGQVVCVLFGCPLKDPQAGETRSFRHIIQAGVPVVVWLRQSPPPRPGTHPVTLEGLVSNNGPIRGLHQTVWQERERNWTTTCCDDVGRHIGLLYEDPDRIPPDFDAPKAFAPAKRRVP
jgi:hypothetical protein